MTMSREREMLSRYILEETEMSEDDVLLTSSIVQALNWSQRTREYAKAKIAEINRFTDDCRELDRRSETENYQ